MRDKELDICRGAIMIYITCFIHLMYWEGVSAGIFAGEWVSVILFEMPVIFYIAGASYLLSEKKCFWKYVRSRVKRVVVPYWKYLLLCLPGIVLVDILRGRMFTIGDVCSFLLFDPRPMSHLFSHTWFILPYLLISFCMPALFWCIDRYRLPFWLFFAGLFLLLVGIPGSPELVQMVIAYLLFTIWGMYYKQNIKWQYVACAIFSAFYLAYTLLVENRPFNMQLNKFPPNGMFVSYCFLLLVAGGSFLRKAVIYMYNRFAVVRQQIDIYAKDGYSIYLIHPFSLILLHAMKHPFGLDNLLAENLFLKLLYIPVGFLFLLYMNRFILRILTFIQGLFLRFYHRAI